MAAVLRIPVVRLDADLPLPAYARAGDAGADLVARQGAVLAAGGGRALVPTGIALAIPEGWAGFVQPRSGLALRHGVTCLNTPGLIDAGYRDELRVLLVNTDPVADYEVRRGDRIAQLVIQRVEHATFAPVEALEESERGTGGFAHTGMLFRRSFVSENDTNERRIDQSSSVPVSVRRLTSWTRRPPSLTRHSSTLASSTAAATPGTCDAQPGPGRSRSRRSTRRPSASTSNTTASVPSPSGSGASSAAASPTASTTCSTSR
jgi:dUTP pyrophosphatase